MNPISGCRRIGELRDNCDVVTLVICANKQVLRVRQFEIEPRNVGIERCRSLGVEAETTRVESVTDSRIVHRVAAGLVCEIRHCNRVTPGVTPFAARYLALMSAASLDATAIGILCCARNLPVPVVSYRTMRAGSREVRQSVHSWLPSPGESPRGEEGAILLDRPTD